MTKWLLLVIVPGCIGAILAQLRGKNPLLWGIICGVLPVLLLSTVLALFSHFVDFVRG